jgi:hypothetical protein
MLSYGTPLPGGVTTYAVLACLWDTVFVAYHAAVAAVAYYQLRVVKEGADMDRIAVVFD